MPLHNKWKLDASPMKKYVGFDKLSKKIQGEGKSKESADAIAASIGRKKYGKEKFQKAAAKGSPMKNNRAKIAADIAAAKERGVTKKPYDAAKAKAEVDAIKSTMEAKKRKKYGGRFGEGNRAVTSTGQRY